MGILTRQQRHITLEMEAREILAQSSLYAWNIIGVLLVCIV
jgi:hypothetical protein